MLIPYFLVFQWYLLCKGNEWFGEIGNCTHTMTEDIKKSKQGKLVFGDIPFPIGKFIIGLSYRFLQEAVEKI